MSKQVPSARITEPSSRTAHMHACSKKPFIDARNEVRLWDHANWARSASKSANADKLKDRLLMLGMSVIADSERD